MYRSIFSNSDNMNGEGHHGFCCPDSPRLSFVNKYHVPCLDFDFLPIDSHYTFTADNVKDTCPAVVGWDLLPRFHADQGVLIVGRHL